ncbi:DUF4230 domain-containing protein [Phaeacidiphilus oryzae]|jgi:hypothetical protein|uniref:DUF4230 domain-containing protein n=1 Tax=Phaeacidiphilus oryzae TaxID=348818 RepID=UPI000564147F|nr:DUF4230 domain-containing protein [Phaeacidiphilus oryzae]
MVAVPLAAALFLGAAALRWVPALVNPFAEHTVDRSGPAVLRSIQDMSRYDAAEGGYQVVVDLAKEARYLPSALVGTRTLYVGAGSVDAYVDLGGIGRGDVKVSGPHTVTVLLPHARLGGTVLDPKHSYVFAQERGVFSALGSLFSSSPDTTQQQVQELAAQKIQQAAASSGLTGRAEQNTRGMLQGLLHSLGYTDVTVDFGDGH